MTASVHSPGAKPRFWTFQLIETGIYLVVLAAALLAIVILRVKRVN